MGAKLHEMARQEPFHSSKLKLQEHFGHREGHNIWSMLMEASIDKETDESLWLSWVERVMKGEPVQYVTGFTWFYGLRIAVAPSVLIPRPETEELVLWANQWKREKGRSTGTAIDWGTGSGCIALAFKSHNPSWRVIARELSQEAVELAARNAEELKLNVEIEWANILETNNKEDRFKADIIFSNPPYISIGEREQMAENVLDHEPFMALFAPGTDPLLFYRALRDRAEEELADNGVMLMEINEFRGNATALIFEEHGWYTRLEKDLSGKNRMLMVAKDHSLLTNYQLI